MSPDAPPPATSAHQDPPHLSALSFTVCLALLLAIFLLLNPFWESETVGEWDENILWSYYPIPLFVAVALRLEGKLGWGPFWLESMKLTFVKFSLTFVGANLAWSWFGAPGTGITPPPVATAPVEDEYGVRPGPLPTPSAPGPRGALRGRLLDAAGEPVAGALVHLVLEPGGRVPAREPEPLELLHRDGRLTPALTWVTTWRPVRLSSAEDDLHTVVVTPVEGGARLFNVPLLARGAREFLFPRPVGEVVVSCSVHGPAEPVARIVVLDHRHATRTDAEGRFALPDLPAGPARLRALDGRGGTLSAGTRIEATTTTEVELRLP